MGYVGIVIGVFLPTIRYHARLVGCEREILRADLTKDVELGFYDMLRVLCSQCRDGTGRRAQWGSRAPMWFTAWAVVQDTERLAGALARYVPWATGGVSGVYRAIAKSDDTLPIPLVEQSRIAGDILEITRTARRLCHPALFGVDGGCPVCGAEKSPDNHLAPALEVHDYWAECRNCGAVWEDGSILTLASSLGLPGVL